MAIYHLSMKTVSRAQGRSTTAAAAYRAGVKIVDRRTGEIHDFTRKSGVLGAAVVLPGGGTMPRAELWNRIEEHHRRKDAVLAREIVIALPAELSEEDRERLALGYARELADRYGVAVDIALHAPGKEGDERNWHAHILMTACYVSPDGTLGKKAVALDPIHCKRHGLPNAADEQRSRWADLANQALAEAGQDACIDHRSHAERGLEELPSYHLGPDVTAIVRRGGHSTVIERAEARISKAYADAGQELDTARAELEAAEQEVQILERAEAASKARREREAALAAEVLEEARKRAEAQQKPAVAPVQETQQERWQRLSRVELEEQIKFREAKLAKGIDYYVDNARGVREVHQKLYELREKTKQAEDFKAKAERMQERWRDAHPYRSKLHDSGLMKNAELAQWEELQAKADDALERLEPRLEAAYSAYGQARSVARINAQSGAVEVKAELGELREILEAQERREERSKHEAAAKAQTADFAKKLEKYTKDSDKSKGSDYGLGR